MRERCVKSVEEMRHFARVEVHRDDEQELVAFRRVLRRGERLEEVLLRDVLEEVSAAEEEDHREVLQELARDEGVEETQDVAVEGGGVSRASAAQEDGEAKNTQ